MSGCGCVFVYTDANTETPIATYSDRCLIGTPTGRGIPYVRGGFSEYNKLKEKRKLRESEASETVMEGAIKYLISVHQTNMGHFERKIKPFVPTPSPEEVFFPCYLQD